MGVGVAFGQTEPNVPDSEQIEGGTTKALGGNPSKATRSSPFSPPKESDEAFVVDDGPFLDTGCTFSSGGASNVELEIELPVTRYVGAVDGDGFLENPRAYVEDGLLPSRLRITMPAFDVDFNASVSGIQPERDEVLFNGQPVDELNPNNERYLTGANGIWKKNAFEIPIKDVKFPQATPGSPIEPAINTIGINIDVGNEGSGRYWCTAIDWVALEGLETAWRPVLLVHGILSDGSTWNKQGGGDISWSDELDNRGIANKAITLTSGVKGLGSIQDNSVEIASAVSDVRRTYGVDKINIVSHSKGGLDSRHYAKSNDDIKKLLMIGTPNAGSPLANLAQGVAIGLTGPVNTALLNFFSTPAGYQLTPAYMSGYNLFDSPNSGTSYIAIAGNHDPGLIDGSPLLFGEDDVIVQVSSVHALSYTVDDKYTSSNGQAIHTSQTGSQDIFGQAYPLLQPSAPRAKSEPLIASIGSSTFNTSLSPEQHISTWVPRTWRTETRQSSGSNTGRSQLKAAKDASSPQTLATQVGFSNQGETSTHAFTIDAVNEASFQLLWGVDDLDLVLIDPSGNRIDPSVAESDPDIEFVAQEEYEGLRYESYALVNPVAGEWTAEVQGVSVTSSSGEGYGVSASVQGSNTTFSATTNFDFYRNGDPIELQAELLQGSTPVAGTTVAAEVVLPDLTKESIQLFDDGTNGDPVANDGVFHNTYTNTNQSGPYRLLISSEDGGTSKATNVPTREETLLVTVSESRSEFNGSFGDAGFDEDGDGLFDELRIQVGTDIDVAGRYIVTGQLRDGSGSVIETTTTEANLSAGAQTVTLAFSGASIFQNGEDGPFALNRLSLVEVSENDNLIVDFIQESHTTTGYPVGDFQRPDLFLTGAFSDAGVDTDGNGRFDQLDVDVEVNVRDAGTYEWGARLVDANGSEIGFDVQSASLSSGENSISLSFDGQQIGGNGVNGPYFVRDLLMFSRTTNANLVASEVAITEAFSFREFEGSEQTECIASDFQEVFNDEEARVEITVEDPNGIEASSFTDDQGNPLLENLDVNLISATNAGSNTVGFSRNTPGDDIFWSADASSDLPVRVVMHLAQADPNNPSAGYYLRTTNGCGTVTVIDPPHNFDLKSEAAQFTLEANYPNPFGRQTTVRFMLPEHAPVKLHVYDVRGRRVATLVDRQMPPGMHELRWNGRSSTGQPLASGTYFYHIEAGDFVQTRRMTLVR